MKPKYDQKFGCLCCFMNKEYLRRMQKSEYSVEDCRTYDMMTEEEREEELERRNRQLELQNQKMDIVILTKK